MQATTEATTKPAPVVPEFISGEHAKLRPVLEADLPALARVMAEAPFGFSWEREPWTVQRLKKKFEDEKEPGLWNRTSKFYVVTDQTGVLVGALREELDRLNGCDVELHIALARGDRDALGQDALRSYMEYKRGWQGTLRIDMALLPVQAAEREWLLANGFERHLRCEEAWLYRGELLPLEIYGWLAPEVAGNRAPDGIGQ
jgi:hypothetical protein